MNQIVDVGQALSPANSPASHAVSILPLQNAPSSILIDGVGMLPVIVADTDVVSFLFKNHSPSKRYDPELAGRIALISFMTVAEVER